MKKIFITVIALIALGNISAYACSCAGPNFSENNKIEAIENFIINKFDIDNIVNIKQVGETQYFSNDGSRVLTSIVGIFMKKEEKNCELSCEESQNELNNYIVEYIQNEKDCSLIVQVKMISNIFSNGFKSKVKNMTEQQCI